MALDKLRGARKEYKPSGSGWVYGNGSWYYQGVKKTQVEYDEMHRQKQQASGLEGLLGDPNAVMVVGGKFRVPAPADTKAVAELARLNREVERLETNRKGHFAWGGVGGNESMLQEAISKRDALFELIESRKLKTAIGLQSIWETYSQELSKARADNAGPENLQNDRAVLAEFHTYASQLAKSESTEAKQTGLALLDEIKYVNATNAEWVKEKNKEAEDARAKQERAETDAQKQLDDDKKTAQKALDMASECLKRGDFEGAKINSDIAIKIGVSQIEAAARGERMRAEEMEEKYNAWAEKKEKAMTALFEALKTRNNLDDDALAIAHAQSIAEEEESLFHKSTVRQSINPYITEYNRQSQSKISNVKAEYEMDRQKRQDEWKRNVTIQGGAYKGMTLEDLWKRYTETNRDLASTTYSWSSEQRKEMEKALSSMRSALQTGGWINAAGVETPKLLPDENSEVIQSLMNKHSISAQDARDMLSGVPPTSQGAMKVETPVVQPAPTQPPVVTPQSNYYDQGINTLQGAMNYEASRGAPITQPAPQPNPMIAQPIIQTPVATDTLSEMPVTDRQTELKNVWSNFLQPSSAPVTPQLSPVPTPTDELTDLQYRRVNSVASLR